MAPASQSRSTVWYGASDRESILPHLPRKSRARLAEGTTAPEPDTLEIVSLRAGASPGMHVVGFDATGESIELRITARDRSAYVAGALLAADWLAAAPDREGRACPLRNRCQERHRGRRIV
jgi:dihydrodipicolinate reductase